MYIKAALSGLYQKRNIFVKTKESLKKFFKNKPKEKVHALESIYFKSSVTFFIFSFSEKSSHNATFVESMMTAGIHIFCSLCQWYFNISLK